MSQRTLAGGGAGWPHGGRKDNVFAPAVNAIQPKGALVMTKAQEIHQRVTALVDAGAEQADAFRQVAEEAGLKYDSVRGAFYTARRSAEGGTPTKRRSRKRETTPQDAVASAVATLEAAIEAIEHEVEAAQERADEAAAEAEAIRSASSGRIEEIRAKIAVLAPPAEDPTKPAARKEAKGS